MTNYKKIKAIVEHGHLCAVKHEDGDWAVYSSMCSNEAIRRSTWHSDIEDCMDHLGISCNSKELINDFTITEIKPIPRKIKMLKVGDKVRILENIKEIKSYEYWDNKAKEMIGKIFEIEEVDSNSSDISYQCDDYRFPHHCVSPVLEEEREETINIEGQERKLSEIKEALRKYGEEK